MQPTCRKRDATNSITMPLGDRRTAGGLQAVRGTRRLVEDAAPQPAGGGVAPRMPPANADELRDTRFKDRTMRDARAGQETTQLETLSDDVHPRVLALFAKIRPAVVIISPSRLLSGLLPGRLLQARLAVIRLRGCRIVRCKSHLTRTLNSNSGLPTFRTAAFDASRQISAVLIYDERGARPCFDNAQDFRARSSKIHMRYRPAMKIADVRVPHDENA
jgi:hypothetical protein